LAVAAFKGNSLTHSPISPPLISIVDDDDQLRLALVGLLRSMGYDTRDHASAQSFLTSSDATTAACLLTDISMPDINGIELKQRLNNASVQIPVIMMTAFAEGAVLARAEAAGPFCILRKPFEINELLECVGRAVAIGLADDHAPA
jgi:FixJ family two-component response regulator